jgi:hypothetical protein
MARRAGNGVASSALLALVISTISCASGSGAWGNAVAKAATVAAVEVAAAAANRGITGCYVSCGGGTVCNEETGLCVPQAECVSTGIRGRGAGCGKTPGYLDATKAVASPSEAVEDDSCAGFCLSTERCVVYRGDLDCVPR